MTILLEPRQADPTFDVFAPFYDEFTAHHRYDEWMASLEALAREHGLRGRRLLDIGCGTGKSFLPFLARGYDVTGCDASEGMLARARAKVGDRVELVQADMRELPELGEFDLVTCIDDPLNYLVDDGDLLAGFRAARGCLAPGGIYVFDLNTLHACRSLFSGDSCHEAEGHFFAWRGRSDADVPAGAGVEATIEAFCPAGAGRWTRVTNEHRQRHHAPEDVAECLDAAGLRLLARFGQFTDGRLEPVPDEARHSKVIHLAAAADDERG